MNIALILAGGSGERVGYDIPKQYIKFNNKPIISYCLETFCNHPDIDCIHIVAEAQWHNFIFNYISIDKIKNFSVPGANRQLSILNGLTDIKKYAKDDDYVIIHDAARPFVTSKLISESLKEVKTHDGVLPTLPMKDTVYMCEDEKIISSLLNRSKIFAGQAPETFILGKYYDANIRLLPNKILEINGSTEPAIMAGMNITTINGDENNFKITTKADLELFEKIMNGGDGVESSRITWNK